MTAQNNDFEATYQALKGISMQSTNDNKLGAAKLISTGNATNKLVGVVLIVFGVLFTLFALLFFFSGSFFTGLIMGAASSFGAWYGLKTIKKANYVKKRLANDPDFAV